MYHPYTRSFKRYIFAFVKQLQVPISYIKHRENAYEAFCISGAEREDVLIGRYFGEKLYIFTQLKLQGKIKKEKILINFLYFLYRKSVTNILCPIFVDIQICKLNSVFETPSIYLEFLEIISYFLSVVR